MFVIVSKALLLCKEELDMAELEIDKDDVHDRKKCYKEEVQPYWKTDYKLIIIIMFVLMVEGMSVVMNVILYLMSVMKPTT